MCGCEVIKIRLASVPIINNQIDWHFSFQTANVAMTKVITQLMDLERTPTSVSPHVPRFLSSWLQTSCDLPSPVRGDEILILVLLESSGRKERDKSLVDAVLYTPSSTAVCNSVSLISGINNAK